MKRIIQIVSFLSLAFIFGGVNVSAQSTTKIDAKVPFDFIMGDRYFAAGDYVLRVSGAPGVAKVVEVRSDADGIIFTGLLTANGETGRNRAELVFDRIARQAVLTKILTEDAGYSIRPANIAKLTASAN